MEMSAGQLCLENSLCCPKTGLFGAASGFREHAAPPGRANIRRGSNPRRAAWQMDYQRRASARGGQGRVLVVAGSWVGPRTGACLVAGVGCSGASTAEGMPQHNMGRGPDSGSSFIVVSAGARWGKRTKNVAPGPAVCFTCFIGRGSEAARGQVSATGDVPTRLCPASQRDEGFSKHTAGLWEGPTECERCQGVLNIESTLKK